MPVLRFKPSRLYELTGLDLEELRELLFRLKCEIEEVEGYVNVEINADRPDMFIGEGLARAVKGLLGVEGGWAKPKLVDSGATLKVESVPTRPYIVGAVVYNVNIDSSDYLEELIQFQEKLHEGLGRRRRKAAIGIHDLEKLPSKTLIYTMKNIDETFKPLNYDKPVKIREVLENDEKGKLYGSISLLDGEHPAIVSGGEIITIPPVLNSDITRLEVGTKHLFIDVTGTDLKTVSLVLNVLVSGLLERGNTALGLVKVESPWNGFYPKFEPKTLKVKPEEVNSILGSSFSPEELASIMVKMRYNVRLEEGSLIVEVPPYRVDVSKSVDLAEDVAICYGYEELGPKSSWSVMRGRLHSITELSRIIRTIMIGLGFTEVKLLSLTSPHIVKVLGLETASVEVLNPVQVEYSVLRPSMATSLLQTLKSNLHNPKPIKIFEIGPVVYRINDSVVDEEVLGLAIMDEEVGYEEIQAPVYSLLRILDFKFKVSSAKLPFLVEGRTAEIIIDSKRVGYMGEVQPEILEKLGLEYPVALAEISLSKLLNVTSKDYS
ncbi:MAG: phenylalanine--tRNA ligase subunit beta [Thermoprotei archaeon]|nr:phenylalanine--tRNA ligase subunit beta [Thermoprotei archaeon]